MNISYNLKVKPENSTASALATYQAPRSLVHFWEPRENRKGDPILAKLFLKADSLVLEDKFIITFFSDASLTPPAPPKISTTTQPDPDRDRQFRMGEILAAIKHGRSRSALVDDRITYRELYNFRDEAQDALFAVIGASGPQEMFWITLKQSINDPILNH